ncbi:MAG: hypothetical protein H8E37_07480 [Planctomycetes bacterium]|nr:hypothetical protein [Planctomycetota bacterium]
MATRRINSLKWKVLGLSTLAVFLAAPIAMLVVEFGSMRRHRNVAERMSVTILSLSEHRPPNVTEDQWAFCLLQAWNLHSNYGGVPSYVPTDDLIEIEKGLRKKIDEGVDLTLFDWLWDEYIRAYPRAANYNKWRPTSEMHKEQFESGAHGGNPLPYWQKRYRETAAEAEAER